MTTQTDSMWNGRLASILGSNFPNNYNASFQNVANAIVPTMMNKIGKTIVSGVDSPSDIFARFDTDMMEYGDVAELIKNKFVNPTDYDPEDSNPFAQSKPDAIVQYDTLNDSRQYPVTVWDRELKKAFQGQGAFDQYVAGVMDSLEQSQILDKRTAWKKYLSDSANIKTDSDVMTLTNGLPDSEEFIEKLRDYCNDKFREPSTSYNVAQDMAISDRLVAIVPRKILNAMQKQYKDTYHPDKFGVDCDFIPIDDFASPSSGNTILGIIVDERALMRIPTLVQTSAIYNPKALATNTFLTVESVFAIDRTRNAIRIEGA